LLALSDVKVTPGGIDTGIGLELFVVVPLPS
jgi:hypothetical protein